MCQINLGKLAQYLKETLREMQKPLIRTDSRVAEIWDRSRQTEISEILRWISQVPYKDNHTTTKDNRTDDTGRWLLVHPQYREWRGSSASMILWLHGIRKSNQLAMSSKLISLAGAGKTKLTSTVVDDIHEVLTARQNDEALAYFYCDRNQTDRQDPASVLRSFVKQLSSNRRENAIQPPTVNQYNQKKLEGYASKELNIGESSQLLHELVDIYPQTTIVLDAMDECNRDTRYRLIEIFDSLLSQSSKPVKIFISSRPDEDIKDRFHTGPNVGIQATDNKDDIAKFVTAKIERNLKWRSKMSDDTQRKVVSTILEKSNGM
jgi:hypothetical protein